jgi:hypothetical protein
MDGSRFDEWTRRRFGLVAGGVATSLLGLAALEAEAKKKKKKKRKKKKRCRKLSAVCTQGGKKKCCGGFLCGHPITSTAGDHCCNPAGTPCSSATASQCCTTICRTDNNLCFCKDSGQSCDSNSQCCSNTCTNGLCA